MGFGSLEFLVLSAILLGLAIWVRTMLKRIEQNEYYRDIFRLLATGHAQNYFFERVAYSYIILGNGDGIATRTLEFSPTRKAVHWIAVRVGIATRKELLVFKKSPRVEAWEDTPHQTISCYLANYEDTGTTKKFLIIPQRPFVPSKQHRVNLRYQWPGVWRGLIKYHTDSAWIHVETHIEVLEVEIITPHHLIADHARVYPHVGEIDYTAGARILWSAQKPPVGLYRLDIVAKKAK